MLFDYSDLLKIMKKAAVDAVEASKPVNVQFGNVVSTSPLRINVEQKLTLEKEMLILAKGLTDYEAETEDGTKVIIRNELKAGDNVILIRMQGGQRFFVLDKVVNI